jgi:hypothetical protein
MPLFYETDNFVLKNRKPILSLPQKTQRKGVYFYCFQRFFNKFIDHLQYWHRLTKIEYLYIYSYNSLYSIKLIIPIK